MTLFDPMTAIPELLNAGDAAARLKCHRSTIGKLVAQGELRCIRYSSQPGARMYFTEELLREFLELRAQQVPPPQIQAPARVTPVYVQPRATVPWG
jgi:excisionase family DNA binding protein